MNTKTIADKLVAYCKTGKNFEAMEQLYADNIVSVEATPRKDGSLETIGKQAVIQKSIDWASGYDIHSGAIDGPYIAHDKFAVTFNFDVTSKATAKRTSLKEVAMYTVANDKIVREEFLYGTDAAELAR